jgi:uncharacterized protein
MITLITLSMKTEKNTSKQPKPRFTMNFTPKNIMLVPSESCPAACSYCFGPHAGKTMSLEILDKAADFIARIWCDKRGKITFHGGEPLCAGYEWFANALATLRCKLGETVKFSIQSNLWLLDDRFIELFKQYAVRVSTSLDGGREVCDRGRGEGYFDKTMRGIHLLRESGFTPYVIATISPQTIAEIPNSIDFFIKEKLPFTLRGAVPSLENGYNEFTVDSSDNRRIFESVFAYYQSVRQIRIRDVDAAVEAVFRKRSGLCVFSNCLGSYAAIAPDGGIYSCQRFMGDKSYQLGTVLDDPDKLTESEAYQRLSELNENTCKQCGDCKYLENCNGGCLYSIAVAQKYGKPQPFCNDEESTPFFYKNLFEKLNIGLAMEAVERMAGKTDDSILLTAVGDIPYSRIVAE